MPSCANATTRGNRVFGCDDCLAVCPWNKFAEAAREARFAAGPATDNPPLAELLTLDDRVFRDRFAGKIIQIGIRDVINAPRPTSRFDGMNITLADTIRPGVSQFDRQASK